MVSCSEKEVTKKVATVKKEVIEDSIPFKFEEVYMDGIPEDKVFGWLTKRSEHIHRGVPITVCETESPSAYGAIFDVYIYYKVDVSNPESNEWRQCMRFSARSYSKLRMELDAARDRLQVFGIVPNDGHEELLLTRERFHDSFTYYIPDHG